MQVRYEGVDITPYAEIVGAVAYDNAGGKADALCLTMQNAQKWYAWKPQRDDTVEVLQNGYTSGRMYLDTIYPEGEKYRVIATSLPAAARQRRWKSYEHTTLREVLRDIAVPLQMEYQVYGLDELMRYPYLLRKHETGADFLSRLLRLEGAVLKCVSGKLAALGIAHCQALEPERNISVQVRTEGLRHVLTDGAGYARAQVIAPGAYGMATDRAIGQGLQLLIENESAADSITAQRWAKGALLWENRKRESLRFSMIFDPGITAMLPVTITGAAAMAGAWMVEQAEHDFINMQTTCSLYRCVTTIT